MPSKNKHNNKGLQHGQWYISFEDDSYIEGAYTNGERIGYWELCTTTKLTRIYYAK